MTAQGLPRIKQQSLITEASPLNFKELSLLQLNAENQMAQTFQISGRKQRSLLNLSSRSPLKNRRKDECDEYASQITGHLKLGTIKTALNESVFVENKLLTLIDEDSVNNSKATSQNNMKPQLRGQETDLTEML